MKPDQKPCRGHNCIAQLIAAAAMVVAGCMDSAHYYQSQLTPAGNQEREEPATGTGGTKGTTNTPASLKTAQPASSPFQSNGIILFDPTSDKNAGDEFVITGTTFLTADTDLFWQIVPDTGTPPTGVEMNAPVVFMANNRVMKGDGMTKRVSHRVDMKDVVPGKHVVLVVSLNGDPMTTDPSTGTWAGHAYITLKP